MHGVDDMNNTAGRYEYLSKRDRPPTYYVISTTCRFQVTIGLPDTNALYTSIRSLCMQEHHYACMLQLYASSLPQRMLPIWTIERLVDTNV